MLMDGQTRLKGQVKESNIHARRILVRNTRSSTGTSTLLNLHLLIVHMTGY